MEAKREILLCAKNGNEEVLEPNKQNLTLRPPPSCYKLIRFVRRHQGSWIKWKSWKESWGQVAVSRCVRVSKGNLCVFRGDGQHTRIRAKRCGLLLKYLFSRQDHFTIPSQIMMIPVSVPGVAVQCVIVGQNKTENEWIPRHATSKISQISRAFMIVCSWTLVLNHSSNRTIMSGCSLLYS